MTTTDSASRERELRHLVSTALMCHLLLEGLRWTSITTDMFRQLLVRLRDAQKRLGELVEASPGDEHRFLHEAVRTASRAYAKDEYTTYKSCLQDLVQMLAELGESLGHLEATVLRSALPDHVVPELLSTERAVAPFFETLETEIRRRIAELEQPPSRWWKRRK